MSKPISANTDKAKRPAPPHAWREGQSGNPNGRPRLTPEAIDLIAACKDKTSQALDVLLSIMQNSESEKNKMQAALAIIERGHGKSVQPTTVGNPDGSPIDMNMTVNLVKPNGS